jgi:hypothetical protein
LQGTIELTKMRVHDGEILIKRGPNGQLNLADLAESTLAGAHVPASPVLKGSPAEASQWVMRLLASLRLSDIAWDDVKITFVDRVGAPGEVVTITVSHAQGKLRNISLKTPMPFDIAATVLTDSPCNIRVRGTVGPIPENLDIGGAPIEAHLQAADLLVAHLTPYLGQRFPLRRGQLGADV